MNANLWMLSSSRSWARFTRLLTPSGPAFSRKVYERALVRELTLRGIKAVPQAAFSVLYKGQSVGEYFADIVVELKCVDCLAGEHMAQCMNYLKACGLKLALLVNFQRPKVEWKRIVYNL